MKILIISYNDINKDGRLKELKKVFEMLGEVYMITNSPDSSEFKENSIICWKQKNYLSFLRFCKKKCFELGSFDLIVADNRNCIIPVIICRKKAKKILYDARELYLLNEVSHIRGKIGCIIEKIFVPHFNIVTCANKLRADVMMKIYNLKTKPISFENIRKLEYSDITEEECEQKYGALFKDKNMVNIVSTSGEALIRKTDELVRAVAKLGKAYRLFLIGYEDAEGHKVIERICKELDWNNIIRYKWLTKSELKFIVSHCDIGVVNYSFQNTNNKLCASGKLYEFVYENIPVVTTTNPTLKIICDKFGIGVSDDSFFEGIRKIMADYNLYKNRVSDFARNNKIEDNCISVAKQINRRMV